MNADLKTPMRPLKPFAARLAPLPPDGQVRVLQFGPSMGVRGGISSVVQLILDFLPQYVSVRHVPTTEEGSAITKASVFARAVQGTGLGLALVAHVVRRHGGAAGFEPAARGAKLVWTLPAWSA